MPEQKYFDIHQHWQENTTPFYRRQKNFCSGAEYEASIALNIYQVQGI